MNEQRSNKILIFLVAFTLMLVVALGGVLGYYVFFKNNVKMANSKNEKIEESVMDLKEFVVNLSDENKTYIKLTISISYDKKNKSLGDELKNKTPIIRDSIINVLIKKSSKDFEAGKLNVFKKDLIEEINKNLVNGKIINIYIQDIIIQ